MHREIPGIRNPDHISITERIQIDPPAYFPAAAAEIGGVDQRIAGWVQLGGKGILRALEAGLKSPLGRWKVRGEGGSDDVSASGCIHFDLIRGFIVAAAQVGGEEDRTGRAIHLGDEVLRHAAVGWLRGIPGWKIE